MIALGLLSAAAFTAAFFAYVYTLKRQLYLLLWTCGWSLVALSYLSLALEPWMAAAPWQTALDHCCWLRRRCFFSVPRSCTRRPAPGFARSRRPGRYLWSGRWAITCTGSGSLQISEWRWFCLARPGFSGRKAAGRKQWPTCCLQRRSL